MKFIENIERNSISKKLSDTFLTVIDLFCNKYLFLTLMINIAIVTKPVVTAISVTTGMYMYYTAETSVIGTRPSRFWGLLSGLYPDKYLFMSVFKIMYLIALLLLTWIIYMFVKRLSDSGKKLFVFFVMDIPAALFFYCTCRPLLSLTMMYAILTFLFALYIVLYSKKQMIYLVPPLSVAAILIDVRIVYLFTLLSIYVLVKKVRFERIVKIISSITLILSLSVFTIFAIASNDNKNSDEVKKYFEDHYSENYDRGDNYLDEETGIYYMGNANSVLLPEGAFKVTCLDLVTEWIPNIADTLVSFTYEDIFQGLCYVYIPLIAIYNHLMMSEEEKRKSRV